MVLTNQASGLQNADWPNWKARVAQVLGRQECQNVQVNTADADQLVNVDVPKSLKVVGVQLPCKLRSQALTVRLLHGSQQGEGGRACVC